MNKQPSKPLVTFQATPEELDALRKAISIYHLYLQSRRGSKALTGEDIETAKLLDSFQRRLPEQPGSGTE